MPSDLDIPFDRITYRDGQLLTARDLRDDRRRDDRLRRLHTRYLHETWGIALGFKVRKAADNKAVVVGPGYAVDSAGRDILLAEGIHVPVPNVIGPETFVLTVSYQEDEAFRDRPDLAGLCLSDGLDPRHERPIFAWRRPEDVRFGPQVPLAHVAVAEGTIQLDFRVRRNARPLVRPHIGWGATEPGRTRWHFEAKLESPNYGLYAIVDTSAAGFTKRPYYFALLRGDFGTSVDRPPGLFQPDAWPTGTEPAFFLNAFGFITNATPKSFTYRIIPAGRLPFGAPIGPEEAENRRWSISWLGIEPVTGCKPVLDLAWIFVLSGAVLEWSDILGSGMSEVDG